MLIHLQSKECFGLDEIGALLWESVEQSGTILQALERIQSEYAVDATTLKQDADAWLKALVARGLLAPRRARGSE